jgi:predicted nucleotidyltransferase component of viral defense system
MLAQNDIIEWRKIANWPTDDQVEQDLIISVCLVKIFNHPYLNNRLAFRGGTALNKLIFPKALRYSEDIDMNRLENENAGPIIDSIREALKSVFSKKAKFKSTDQSIKLMYTYSSIIGQDRKLKIEINVRETLPQEKIVEYPFEVNSGFFSGKASIRGFCKEEIIGTKIRALYQRTKGRDLFDLYELGKLDLDWDKIVNSFKKLDIGASSNDFKKNLEEKMKEPMFIEDIVPLLPTDAHYSVYDAHEWFVNNLLERL